jgi:hypothetical protein
MQMGAFRVLSVPWKISEFGTKLKIIKIALRGVLTFTRNIVEPVSATFRFSAAGKNMILDATDDFKKRTLSALPTLLEKLAYICSLQTQDGEYAHWGMSRLFGQQSACEAIESAHSETAIALISIPIQKIYDQFLSAVERPGSAELLKPESFFLNSPANDDELLSAHLRLIQNSVASLALQEEATRRVA